MAIRKELVREIQLPTLQSTPLLATGKETLISFIIKKI